jgi:hypothetical protein
MADHRHPDHDVKRPNQGGIGSSEHGGRDSSDQVKTSPRREDSDSSEHLSPDRPESDRSDRDEGSTGSDYGSSRERVDRSTR